MTKGRTALPGRVVAEWELFVPLEVIKERFLFRNRSPRNDGSLAHPR
jgi:hypothetical protein